MLDGRRRREKVRSCHCVLGHHKTGVVEVPVQWPQIANTFRSSVFRFICMTVKPDLVGLVWRRSVS